MCFHQLPIEFDAQGRPVLREGGWASAPPPASPSPAAEDPEGLREFTVSPVTRIAGSMDFYSQLDLASRRVHDARASAAAFRGYEVLLRNRDPREAMDISSRVCGVCGGVHSTTSSMALDMALPVRPPPLGVIARNIAQAAEFLYDHALHMCLLAGPDYSEATVRRAEPSLWTRAEGAPARFAAFHGYATVGELMSAFNPLSGALYLEAFARTRLAMEMVATVVGNYPHPTTMVPGGINVLLTEDTLRRILDLADQLLDYVKKLILAYEELMSFYEEARPEYVHNGERPAHLISFGRYDDVESYDGTYRRLDEWGTSRSIPPGVVIGGEMRTTSLRAINLGLEEFVDHSFYEHWSGDGVPADPEGGPLSPFHPWNKETRPKPTGRSWKERYTWATAPRWDREVVEAGPIARNWIQARTGLPRGWGGMLHPEGDALRFTLPRGPDLPACDLVWRVPTRVNTLERNRARAYHLGITWLQIYLDCHRGIDLLRQGERRVWTEHQIPESGIGMGLWEAARGALAHWLVIEDRLVKNYQIITPSSFNASPRDPWGKPGPYEEAALNTPILEEFTDPESFLGIDLMRMVRSFDPCMPCAVHMHTGAGTVTREVVSCGCGADV